jgi:cytochrome c-type biogenesis protein CcmI
MAIVIALVLVVALAAFVVAPIMRRGGEEDDPPAGEDPDLADLEARKESLYRQIRDAELDREQGKLSPADWERVDAELRRDAIAVLKAMDAAGKSDKLRPSPGSSLR